MSIDWKIPGNVERLTAWWIKGVSTAEIGRRMGGSKHAIVGKAHKLKLPSRPSPINRSGSGRKPRRAPAVTLPALSPMVAVAAPAVAAPPPVAIAAAPRPVALSTRRSCDFPLWPNGARPTHRYCGAPVPELSSYCEAHRRVCYTPATVNRAAMGGYDAAVARPAAHTIPPRHSERGAIGG